MLQSTASRSTKHVPTPVISSLASSVCACCMNAHQRIVERVERDGEGEQKTNFVLVLQSQLGEDTIKPPKAPFWCHLHPVTLQRLKNVTYIFSYTTLPDFRRASLRPLVLQAKATCIGRWIWSNCGMILTKETRNTRRKTISSATLSATNLTWTDLGSNIHLRGERPINSQIGLNWIIKTQFVPRSKHFSSRL